MRESGSSPPRSRLVAAFSVATFAKRFLSKPLCEAAPCHWQTLHLCAVSAANLAEPKLCDYSALADQVEKQKSGHCLSSHERGWPRRRMVDFAHHTMSPYTILMAKSQISVVHVWQVLENPVCQRAGPRENDFASSIKSAQEPLSGQMACELMVIRINDVQHDDLYSAVAG
jgi:hypothetical protein